MRRSARWRVGIRARYRRHFWRTLSVLAVRNPRALRDMVGLMALFVHFDSFRDFLVAQIDRRIEGALQAPIAVAVGAE